MALLNLSMNDPKGQVKVTQIFHGRRSHGIHIFASSFITTLMNTKESLLAGGVFRCPSALSSFCFIYHPVQKAITNIQYHIKTMTAKK